MVISISNKNRLAVFEVWSRDYFLFDVEMGFGDLESLRSLMSLLMMAILIRLGSEVHYPQARLVDDSQLPDLEGQALDFVGKDQIRTCHECHRIDRNSSFGRASTVSIFLFLSHL